LEQVEQVEQMELLVQLGLWDPMGSVVLPVHLDRLE